MFLCILYKLLGPPRQVPWHAICGTTPFLSFLAYYMYMGATSDQFLHFFCWRHMEAFLCLFFHTIWGAPQISSLHTILGPPDHFLRLLYGAPQISFFSYNMGAPLRSVSLFTICPPPHQISFFACYRGATTDFSFFTKYMGGPLRSVSPLTIWGPSG